MGIVHPWLRAAFFDKLSIQGKVAYESHKKFHQDLCDKMIAYLKGLSPEQIKGILGYIAVAEENLPDLS